MAGRRLAISSLLCEDDPPPPQCSTSPAGPSYSPPPPLESGPAPFRNSYQPVYSDADPRRGPSPLPTGRDTLPPVSQLHDLSLRSTQPRPHQSLHTPHEYVNLRRDLQTSPFDGNDHINPTSVSSLTHTYSPLDYNRLRSHPSQPDPSQHQLPSFTPSESYTFHYHSPLIDSSPLLARPTSSRSHHSHSPSTSFSFPHLHHSQSPHHSHSPSHSPLLPHSTQSRRAPESPSLPVLRPSASPNNYYSTSYSPRHTQSPYTLHPVHNHSPNTQLHPSSTTFSEMSPHQHTPLLPLHSPSHVRPTLAALLTSSSPVSLSAASLPNLLNNVSPITRTPASAFRPLDALVQAASQERRRISGEAQKPPLLEDSPTQSAFQAEKTHEPLETRPYQPYSQQSSYDDPSQHVLTSPVSASRLLHDGRPLGNDYAPHIEEPPAKRRRSSIESLGLAGIAVTSQDVSKVSLRLPSPVVNTPTVPETTSAVLQESTPQEADTKPILPPETLSEVRVETGGWSRPESHVPFAEGSGGAMSESGQRDENGRVDRKPAKTPGKQKGKEPSQIITAEPAKQRPHEHESQEQDPHEWLLEHYAASPTVAPAIPPPPDKATTVEAGRMTAQVDAKREKKNDAKAPSRGGKHKTKKPEMASHLKAPSPVPPNDIDLELELATASSHSHVPAKREDPAEMDVDDELLSLVDDKPQPSHASHHQPAPSHTSTHSHLENLKPNSANKLVASGHVITRSPSVTTTYTERGSMPPPSASTSIPPREDGKPSTKATDHPANVGASGSKKKVSVPKVSYLLFKCTPHAHFYTFFDSVGSTQTQSSCKT